MHDLLTCPPLDNREICMHNPGSTLPWSKVCDPEEGELKKPLHSGCEVQLWFSPIQAILSIYIIKKSRKLSSGRKEEKCSPNQWPLLQGQCTKLDWTKM